MNGTKMEFTITEHQNCAVIQITGRIDSYTTPNIKQTLISLIENGHHNFVMDLGKVNYLSSSGILMFVNLQKRLNDENLGKVVFSNVPELIYSNIKLAGFDQFFEFFQGTNTAVRRF
jgi:anti-sigma B factor antagonist